MWSMANSRVLVIGELNVDVVVTGLDEPPRMGSEILAADCSLTLGSASAIFASGLAKLGLQVTFVSQVGADYLGRFCLNELRAAGVSTRNVSRDKRIRTGVTVALSTDRDRALVTYPGAIASFTYDHLRRSMLKTHRHLHMSSYFLQTGLRPAFARIFRQARAQGLSTSFDPNSDPKNAWAPEINDVLDNTSILFLNEFEALQLTKAKDVLTALRILGRKVPCAVIKLGSKGSVAISDGKTVSADGFQVDAIDTTGAGDSFAAGFVAASLRGKSLFECLRAGNACGALSTLGLGGSAGQPNAAQLRKFLKTRSQVEFSSD
jgi:sugar/nucleoside kinase (ribokinase family)